MANKTAAARGGKNSGEKRRLKQSLRIMRVHQMRTVDKMSKADIARTLGVAYETILRDCKTFEDSENSERRLWISVIDAVLEIARREVAGEITTLEARDEIGGLIELILRGAFNPHIQKKEKK